MHSLELAIIGQAIIDLAVGNEGWDSALAILSTQPKLLTKYRTLSAEQRKQWAMQIEEALYYGDLQ